MIKGTGDILAPELIDVEIDSVSLALLAGDLTLSDFEDDLATVWPECANGRERAFQVTSAIWRVIQKAIDGFDADLVLIDMGTDLGSINRAIMIATDYIVMPLAADLFSVQGLKNLGPTLNRWRRQWQERTLKNPAADLQIPTGSMEPIGYVAMLHTERVSQPTLTHQRWLAQIPNVYQTEMLGQIPVDYPSFAEDPNFLGKLKHYRSLISMAQEAHKPIFYLKPADGVVGGHYYAVQEAHRDFLKLAQKIEHRLPQS